MSMSMRPDSSRLRMAVLGVVVISLFAAMLARLWYLQVLSGPTYRTEAQQNRVRIIVAEAPRGRILDRQGRVLVANRVVSAVVVNRAVVAEEPEVIARLSPVLGVSEPELARRLADELARVDGITEHMRRTLTDALGEAAPVQLRLDELDQPERRQLEADRAAWRARLDGLDAERERERVAIEHRFGAARELTFPVAVVLVARPEHE